MNIVYWLIKLFSLADNLLALTNGCKLRKTDIGLNGMNPKAITSILAPEESFVTTVLQKAFIVADAWAL